MCEFKARSQVKQTFITSSASESHVLCASIVRKQTLFAFLPFFESGYWFLSASQGFRLFSLELKTFVLGEMNKNVNTCGPLTLFDRCVFHYSEIQWVDFFIRHSWKSIFFRKWLALHKSVIISGCHGKHHNPYLLLRGLIWLQSRLIKPNQLVRLISSSLN